MQMRPDLGLASIWNVTKFWFCKFTDISVLRLTPRTTEHLEYNWRTPTLCLAPPSLGDRIASFGYMKSHANAENQKITWYVEGVTSVGTVKEVYPLGRDKVMLPFPCFRTNMRIEGGMSGGPAFDDNGQLIGINCSGFSAQDAGGEHTGHISCLWPLMGLKVDMETSIHSQGTFYPLLDLASRGIIHTSNLDCISLAHDGMLYYHEKK